MVGLRDLPDEQRAVWKNLFDHYVFNPKQNILTYTGDEGGFESG